jgi:hypothetical protein
MADKVTDPLLRAAHEYTQANRSFETAIDAARNAGWDDERIAHDRVHHPDDRSGRREARRGLADMLQPAASSHSRCAGGCLANKRFLKTKNGLDHIKRC